MVFIVILDDFGHYKMEQGTTSRSMKHVNKQKGNKNHACTEKCEGISSLIVICIIVHHNTETATLKIS